MRTTSASVVRLLLVGLAIAPSLLTAQDLVPKIEYHGGHAGMDKKVKGSLMISDSALKFTDEKGATLIVVQMGQITGISSSIDRKEASVGSKMAFGMFAKSRKEELVTVSYETSETAEGLVFRTEKNVSVGLVAKLQFRMKRAGTQAADTAGPSKVVRVPLPD